jgi:hypothetical protein
VGLGLDHWCAIVVNGPSYALVSPPDMPGSVLPNGSFSADRKGVPGLWILKASEEGALTRTLAPKKGKLADLLRSGRGEGGFERVIVEDQRLAGIRQANPCELPKIVAMPASS